MTDASDKRIAELEKELHGTQEILGFVLKVIDENVIIPKAVVAGGIGEKSQIVIDDDGDNFIIRLETV